MLTYDIVDVFTDRPFAGNQLAVVHGADDLSTAQCQQIAQEFNFSETTFPSSRVEDGPTVRRTAPGSSPPASEIPFAGHPTLGTAWVLRERGLVTGPDLTQVCGAGPVGVRFADDDRVELSATPRDLLGPLDDELVVALLQDVGLSLTDLAGPVWVAGCGLTFVHLPVVEDAVVRADPSSRPLRSYAADFARVGEARDPIEGINLHHVVADDGAGRLEVHARVFVPGLSVEEDPATGSAAVGLGMALVAAGRLPEGGGYAITQGVEMGRPVAAARPGRGVGRGGHALPRGRAGAARRPRRDRGPAA